MIALFPLVVAYAEDNSDILNCIVPGLSHIHGNMGYNSWAFAVASAYNTVVVA